MLQEFLYSYRTISVSSVLIVICYNCNKLFFGLYLFWFKNRLMPLHYGKFIQSLSVGRSFNPKNTDMRSKLVVMMSIQTNFLKVLYFFYHPYSLVQVLCQHNIWFNIQNLYVKIGVSTIVQSSFWAISENRFKQLKLKTFWEHIWCYFELFKKKMTSNNLGIASLKSKQRQFILSLLLLFIILSLTAS